MGAVHNDYINAFSGGIAPMNFAPMNFASFANTSNQAWLDTLADFAFSLQGTMWGDNFNAPVVTTIVVDKNIVYQIFDNGTIQGERYQVFTDANGGMDYELENGIWSKQEMTGQSNLAVDLATTIKNFLSAEMEMTAGTDKNIYTAIDPSTIITQFGEGIEVVSLVVEIERVNGKDRLTLKTTMHIPYNDGQDYDEMFWDFVIDFDVEPIVIPQEALNA
jgi:hypothetical protein